MGVNDEDTSLSPLPISYRRSQIGMAVVGTLSMVFSSCLFVHITYRLVTLWWTERESKRREEAAGVDLSLGLSERHYLQTKAGGSSRPSPNQNAAGVSGDTSAPVFKKRKAPNPLLILIYNLIFADVGFSAAYMANFVWLGNDAIIVGSATCNVQGWLVSFGCLISSAFLVTLATYTYFIVIKGWRASSKLTVIHSVIIWALSILVTCLGVMFTRGEHYFVRQQFWVRFPASFSEMHNPPLDSLLIRYIVLDRWSKRWLAPFRLHLGIFLHICDVRGLHLHVLVASSKTAVFKIHAPRF